MSQESDSFVSVFKIDGKPILPPVIDDVRRIEISRDRQLAIEVEHRLRLQQKQKTPNSQVDLMASDNEETLVKGATECSASNYDTSAAVDSLLDDNISTLKDEIESAFRNIPSINEPNDDEKNATNEQKPSKIVPLSLIIDTNFNTFNVENISPNFSLHSSPSMGALNDSRNQSLYFTPMSGRESFTSTPNGLFPSGHLIRSNSFTIEKPSPMLLQHMEANGIHIGSNCSPLKSPRFLQVNEFKQTQKNTPQKRLQSIDIKDSAQIKEQKKKANTSKVLLNKSVNKSMSSNSSTSLNSTIVNHSTIKTSSPYAVKSTKKQKSATKPKQSNHSDFNCKNGESSIYKNTETILRSIYEPSKPTKTPVSAKTRNGSIASLNSSMNGKHTTLTRTSSTKTIVEPISSRSSNISNGNFQDILAMIEHQHEAQMQALVQRQQDEQKRMQAEFQRQQNELLLKISNLIANKMDNKQSTSHEVIMADAKKSNEKMLIEEVNNDVTLAFDTNGNRLFTRFTPENSKCMRRLYYDDNKLVSDELETPSSLSTVSSDPLIEYTANEIAAATIIAAYMRGHLTRRLMKTTKVQNIVNTRRDSLLIALDMHYESKERSKNGTQTESETEADIELKSQLIQQLASASQNLHDIFVEISMAERMDIIAKDREWQRKKLNRSKLSNNNKNHMFVNGNSHLARSQSASFDKKF